VDEGRQAGGLVGPSGGKTMFESFSDLLRYVKKHKTEALDLKYVDLFGRWHHITLPASALGDRIMTEGIGFDSSNAMGFKSVEAGDMVLIPDLATVHPDPFWDVPTLSAMCSVYEADTKELYHRDPRALAERAEEYLRQTRIADESVWGPEFEFYIFDSVSYQNDVNASSYVIDSDEAAWNSGLLEGRNLGYKIPPHGGYQAIPPSDSLYRVRAEMVKRIEEAGIPVRYHHHEVGGPGQSEIEIIAQPLAKIGDYTMMAKHIVKMVARQHNQSVTFMPKPLYNEAGSGMHFHQQLFKAGKPLFYSRGGYAQLSKLALHYIGGLLTHGPALLAITSPGTNSYKRLIPGFEAPVNCFFSLANRSAAIRIPKYATRPAEKRIEFRPPDATCNAYLAMAAQLLAGVDGVLRKIDPTEAGFGPIDENVFDLRPKDRAKIKPLPSSLKEALDALRRDHEFLLQGGVFTEDIVETWIDWKLHQEYEQVRNRPHPYEMTLYYDA
jgi:glutamine synthetase